MWFSAYTSPFSCCIYHDPGIEAIHGLLIRRLRVEIDGECEHVPGNQQSLEQPSKPGYVPVINPNQPVLELDPYFEVPIEHDLPPESEIGNPALLAHALRLLRNLSVRKPQQVKPELWCA